VIDDGAQVFRTQGTVDGFPDAFSNHALPPAATARRRADRPG
jgi:hypothetical protein